MILKSIVLLFIGLLNLLTCQAQAISEIKQVQQFKDNFLSKVNMYEADTIHVSTAMLTRERLPNVRRITTYPKNKLLRNVEYFYNDTKILESNHSYTLPTGEMTGISKQYNKKGELEYIQDHDKGTWEVLIFDNYPYYQTLVNMKEKVDSLIIVTYGQQFYDQFVVWYPESSSFHDAKYKGATWHNYQEWEPKRFQLGYSIRLSQNEIYDEQIVVQLDSLGNIDFPYESYDDIKGFEKTQVKNGFVLNKQSAIKKAKKLGLVENDSKKAFTFLKWEYNKEKKKEIYNGYFTYNVANVTDIIVHKPIGARNRIEYKYDVFSFNPWTGEFTKKQRMKSYREWGKHSGHSTRLIADN